MNNSEIVFSRPELLFLLIPALALTLLPYLLLPLSKKKSIKRAVTVLLRMAIVTVLCLVISGINLVHISEEQSVAIVVDLSDSTKDYRDEMIAKAVQLREEFNSKAGVCVIAFAENSLCQIDFHEDKTFTTAELEGNASDISSALEYAAGLLPKDRGRRIILLSDGRQTEGDALDSARYAAGQGIRIDAVYYDPAAAMKNEVQVSSLKAPDGAFAGTPLTLTAEVDALHPISNATLYLTSEGKTLKTLSTPLEEGSNVFSFEVFPKESGKYIYRLTLSCEEDGLEINNSAAVSVQVAGKPKVLIVGNWASDSLGFRALLEQDCDVDFVTPLRVPRKISELCAYDEVVLVNIDAEDLPTGYDRILYEYVNKYGRTLFTAGGDRTYTMGNMKDTGYEQMLPINMESNRPESGKDVALMLVIDSSRSMSMGFGNRLALAKQSAIMCVNTLNDTDYVGVISFSSSAILESELVRATDEDKNYIARVISAIQTGSGTGYTSPLQLAYEQLNRSEASLKHVIFLSDGEPFDTGYNDVVYEMRQSGITVSTIGLAYLSSALEEIADIGGGEYYYAPDASDLPEIMISDAKMIAGGLLVRQPTKPMIVQDHSIFEGIDGNSIPMLDGYMAVEAKEDAEVLLKAENGDPILAIRKLGAGMTVSFMSDVTGTWTGEWYTSTEGDTLVRKMVTETFNPIPLASSLNVVFGETGESTKVTVEIPGTAEDVTLEMRVTSRQGTERVPLWNTGKGLYTGVLQTKEPDSYQIFVSLSEGGAETDRLDTDLIVSYKKEYDLVGKDGRQLLEDICRTGQGQVYESMEDTGTLLNVLPETAEYSTDLLLPLAILASLMLIVDITVRKLRWRDVKQFFKRSPGADGGKSW